MKSETTFVQLVESIQNAHSELTAQAGRAVNISLTLRNWLISHENLGQLNTYVNWYRQEMMTEGDNPPVGILLCTDKNHALVEYALAGMDNQLFVSKYLLELPDKEEIQRFVDVYYSYMIFSLKKPV